MSVMNFKMEQGDKNMQESRVALSSICSSDPSSHCVSSSSSRFFSTAVWLSETARALHLQSRKTLSFGQEQDLGKGHPDQSPFQSVQLLDMYFKCFNPVAGKTRHRSLLNLPDHASLKLLSLHSASEKAQYLYL